MKITKVTAFPLELSFAVPQKTSQMAYTKVSICIVRIDTDQGITGAGECLARFGAAAYARLITDLLAPKLIGKDPHNVKKLWDDMRSSLNGRSGGILFEAIAGIDIALWDIKGKALGVPLSVLLGGKLRHKIPVYASSIMVGEDVEAAAERIIKLGFRMIKIKTGKEVLKEISRVEQLRKFIGPDYEIMVDANYIYDEYEALQFARGTADCRVCWFEEPIDPEDRAGYKRLSRRSPLALAAGESEFTAHDCSDIVSSGAVQFIQPDITRSGGITETWRIAVMADIFNVKYAPHVGFSGAVCVAASLQLAAAAPNLYSCECMVTPNEFRERLAVEPAGLFTQVSDGHVQIPERPGIGIELNWDEVKRLSTGF